MSKILYCENTATFYSNSKIEILNAILDERTDGFEPLNDWETDTDEIFNLESEFRYSVCVSFNDDIFETLHILWYTGIPDSEIERNTSAYRIKIRNMYARWRERHMNLDPDEAQYF